MTEVYTAVSIDHMPSNNNSTFCLEATSRHLEGLMTHSVAMRSFRCCVQGKAIAFMDLLGLLI